MTATNPLTYTGHQIADLQFRIQFLEADKRIQDLLIAARDAEIERLREALEKISNGGSRDTGIMVGKKYVSYCNYARAALERQE